MDTLRLNKLIETIKILRSLVESSETHEVYHLITIFTHGGVLSNHVVRRIQSRSQFQVDVA